MKRRVMPCLPAGKILVQSCQEVAAQIKANNSKADISNIGYEDIGEAAFGSFGRKLVSTTVYTELLGICALLFILEVGIFEAFSFCLLETCPFLIHQSLQCQEGKYNLACLGFKITIEKHIANRQNTDFKFITVIPASSYGQA